jgi:phosphoribosylformimino-5-aminoimidazole carboxamide ribotide isomerase
MRIIPVIDLQGGGAVRGRSGDRARYRPVRSRVGGGEPRDLSEPLSLLAAYRETIRPATIYVADLDRITGQGDHDALLDRLVGAAPDVRFLWDGGFLDAAASSRPSPPAGAVVPVIGTETLRSIDALPGPGAGSGLVLSLDLDEAGLIGRFTGGTPLHEEDVLDRARQAGFRSVVLLLLDRVGTVRGLPRERLLGLRRRTEGLDLIAGGGIAGLDDLKFLRDAGFSGALLATALHDGLVSPADLRREGFLDGAGA